MTYDGTTLKYYLDGKEVASAPKSLATAPGPLVLGACVNHTAYFTGAVGEVALFNRALTVDEVQQICQMGSRGVSLAVSGDSTH